MLKRIGTLLLVLMAVAACGAPAPTAAPTAAPTVAPAVQPTATAVRLAPTNTPAPTNTAVPAATPVPALAEFKSEEGYWTLGSTAAKVLMVDSSDFG